MKPRILRLNLLIYPKFQLTLVALNALAMSGIFAVIWFHASSSYARLRTLGLEAHLSSEHPYFKVLELQSHDFYSHLIWAFAVGFVVFTFATLYLSNRLAGPIVRMIGYFRGLAESDSATVSHPLEFRSGDFFAELPPLINRALERLQKR